MGSFCLDQEDRLQGGGIQKEPKVQHNNLHVPPRTWDGPLKGRAWLREARDSWATGRRESEDGRDQCPAHRLWGARGAGCGDGAAGGSSLRSQPQYPDHLLFLQDPGAADSLPPASAELGSCGQWDQPERPHCSHIQPSPALALRLGWLPGSWLPGLCDSVGQHLQQCSYRLGALSPLLHPNFTSFLFTMSFFNFAMPLFITITSYSLMEQKLGKSGHLQVPALIAKMVPTINAINYALGNEMVCRGIWQCLSPQKSEKDRAK
nr:RPE-retinal G protein-coupled receptor isoform X4 [Chlorocebus sabaeus]